MRKSERNIKSVKKIRKLLVMCSLMTVIIAASTYAWFVGMRTVNVSSFDVEVASTDTLLLSLNGSDWSTTVNISGSTFSSSSYVGNTNKWAGRGLIPMSTVGAMDTGASRMKIFEKASVTTTPGGYRLMASRVDNFSNPTSEEPDGYVVFDLFIKNFSGTQYLENLNILDEEAIYLKTDSEVTVAETGVANTGIENSVRVAFAQIGRVKGTSNDASIITGITCTSDAEKKTTGICRTAQIWEPNDTLHTANAINWYNASCLSRTGADVTGESSYSGACKMITNGTAYPTYSVRDDVLSSDNVDIYDGEEYNGYTPNSKASGVDTFTDTEKLLTGTSRPTFMMLAPNSITKVRIYIYIEGQDIDNYDFASIGKAISVKFGFTKDRFDMEPSSSEAKVSDPTSCFEFSNGEITDYYYYEGNDSSSFECDRNVVIPESIDETPVTAIGASAFASNSLTGVEIPGTIKTIKTGAFSNNQISSVNIPSTVLTIGASAFKNNKLTSITIPSSVTSLGVSAFENNLLTSAVIPSSLNTIADKVFLDNKLTSISIPSSVTSLGASAFKNNNISSLTIPNSVTSLGSNVFQNNLIASLTLPNNIDSLPNYAFDNNRITSLVMPNSIEYMDNYVFSSNSITSLDLSDNLIYMMSNTFTNNQITNLIIPNSMVSLGNGDFEGNPITSLTLPEGLEEINDGVFYGNELATITIPSTVKYLGNSAFETSPGTLKHLCIKGKSNFSAFEYTGVSMFSWYDGYSDSNITWNCTE